MFEGIIAKKEFVFKMHKMVLKKFVFLDNFIMLW